ncbi:threonine/serine exporter family protein, partial [Micrococcus sp. SIMBA_131]
MTFVAQIVTSFVASAAFGLLFNAPKSSLIKGGFVGMCGWMIYYVMEASGIDVVVATVTASFFIAVISQVFAKMYRT